MKLKNYIKGNRKGKEIHELERKAFDDPFLQDALDGFDEVQGNHSQNIRKLQSQLSKKNKQTDKYFIISIAASLFIILSIGTYWLWRPTPIPENIAKLNKLDRVENVTIIPSLPEDTMYSDTQVNKNKIRAKAFSGKRVEIEAPASPSAEIQEDTKVEEEIANTIDNLKQNQITTRKRESIKELINEKDTPLEKNEELFGKVVDEQGEALAGAVIRLKGTDKGVITDQDGKFTIEGSGQTLEVSFLGYENLEVKADTNMLLALKESTNELAETVVVGYGVQKKQSLSGSISTITSQEEIDTRIKPKPLEGKRAFNKYLKEKTTKPIDGPCKDIKGNVILEFDIRFDGRPYNIRVIKSLCPQADEEAIRLIEEGPNWISGDIPAEISIRF